ncbi:cyclopropane-fatty-acyl-phospholipid synthase family protein [Variovorax rhizosphaerae]|uniref:Cyclopropane-fatty-acyl-phospholipid synthase family protein n=1 Tax=Variovorax rhizosphaerae TaxID=1836200 RepID=A0ABU8WH49_9BURK
MQSLIPKIESRLDTLAVPIALELPDGRRVAKPGSRVTLAFSDWSGLAKLAASQIGALGELYVEGRVQIEGAMRDLTDVAVGLLPGNPVETNTGWWGRLLRRAKSRGAHSLDKDAAQVEFHYDVSDDFYALWLDPRRVYSCAYFKAPGMTLAQAQEAKLDHICRKLMLAPGQRFLDIGSGWGALLLWAAEHYGVDATGITLSKNQHAYVQRLIDAKGLGGRVRVELRDYRELTTDKPFDRIASVGMFEHVGAANMPGYFARINELLVPGGMAMNHGITSGRLDQDQLGNGMGDFIEKYIFPGGELLHVTHVLREMAVAGLEMVDTENLRPHYARTLWNWSDGLESKLDAALAVLQRSAGSRERAERILRAYRLYLAGSAMSFEQGWISLHQILAIKPDGKKDTGLMPGAHSAYPFVRDHIYR